MEKTSSYLFIPPEIVREIVLSLYLLEAPRHATSPLTHFSHVAKSSKTPWSPLDALSRTSREYRDIVLDVWFTTLQVTQPHTIEAFKKMFPKNASRTRTLLCCINPSEPESRFDLGSLPNLQLLRIDCRTLRKERVIYLSPFSPFRMFPGVPGSLAEVHVNSNRHQDLQLWPSVFRGIETFANLTTLRLFARSLYCEVCDCLQSPFLKTPFNALRTYDSTIGLPPAYTKALCRLEHLSKVTIVVPVESSNASEHALDLRKAGGARWSGECEKCFNGSALSEEPLASKWVALKEGRIEEYVHFTDVGRVTYQQRSIPNLRTVEYHFIEK